MNLKTLFYFLKVAEYENITKAAQELHIAQPHLTRQIHSLEEELHVTLFIREKKRLHITEEGLFLKQQASSILGLVNKTKEQITEMEMGITGTLYIGSTGTIGTIYLPQWISGFKKQYPQVHYDLWSCNSLDVVERLEKGLIDLAFIREPFDHDKFNYYPILKEKWLILVNKAHPLSHKDIVSLKDLSQEELLVPTQRKEEVSQWFSDQHLEANIVCGYSPLMNAIVMVENNLGIALLPESCRQMDFEENVVIKDILEERMSEVSLLWRKEYSLSASATRFLDYVKAHPINKKDLTIEVS